MNTVTLEVIGKIAYDVVTVNGATRKYPRVKPANDCACGSKTWGLSHTETEMVARCYDCHVDRPIVSY